MSVAVKKSAAKKAAKKAAAKAAPATAAAKTKAAAKAAPVAKAAKAAKAVKAVKAAKAVKAVKAAKTVTAKAVKAVKAAKTATKAVKTVKAAKVAAATEITKPAAKRARKAVAAELDPEAPVTAKKAASKKSVAKVAVEQPELFPVETAPAAKKAAKKATAKAAAPEAETVAPEPAAEKPLARKAAKKAGKTTTESEDSEPATTAPTEAAAPEAAASASGQNDHPGQGQGRPQRPERQERPERPDRPDRQDRGPRHPKHGRPQPQNGANNANANGNQEDSRQSENNRQAGGADGASATGQGPRGFQVPLGPDGKPRKLSRWERFRLKQQQRKAERIARKLAANGQLPTDPEGKPILQKDPEGRPVLPPRQPWQRPEPPPLGPPEPVAGILEIQPKGYGSLRLKERNFIGTSLDPFITPEMVRNYGLRDGLWIEGTMCKAPRGPQVTEIHKVNGMPPDHYRQLPLFEELTAVNPNKRYILETDAKIYTTRLMDMICPIGRGQRGLIVAAPRAGKTTFLEHVAQAIQKNYKETKLIILLVDERPEEVTEITRNLPGAEIMASSNDQDPRLHVRLAELAIERCKRLVEAGEHVFMLMDSITRLARAFNNVLRGGGKAMSGGIDSRALQMPRKIFAAARNTREGGSLTILATALIETNNRGDDLIFQEFKGTGNMELVLDRRIAQQFIYPAVDIFKSGTRREELLLPAYQLEKVSVIRRGLAGHKPAEAMERLNHFLERFRSNNELLTSIGTKQA